MYNKKIFVVMFSVFMIAVLVSFSYAHFVKNDILGNEIGNVNIITKSSEDLTKLLEVSFDNNGYYINIDHIETDSFEKIIKMKLDYKQNETNKFSFYLKNIVTDLNLSDTSYEIYECSESDYNNSTVTTVENLCTLKTTNTLPPTNFSTSLYTEEFNSIMTKYYVLKLNINNNISKSFRAVINMDSPSLYPTLSEAIYATYTPVSDSSIDFSITSSTSGTNGLYINDANDGDGTIKYFRGEVNNYVTFAGRTWRVMHINSQSKIRLITEDNIQPSIAFNAIDTEPKHVGYTYDRNENNLGTSSTIKSVLDEWYRINLSSYTSYINQQADYCNDTSGSNSVYGGYTRLYINRTPTYNCPTPTPTYGGVYHLPIATITADEVTYAGGVYDTDNPTYYLNNDSYFWTMTPFNYYIDAAIEYRVGANGNLHYYTCSATSLGLRAVVELNSHVLVTGQGTFDNPWVVL